MTCIKKIKSEEISGSTFKSRKITFNGDIYDYSFTAKVKSSFKGKIAEIQGVKTAGSVFFDFISLENLRNGKYIIEYWGDFGALGNEPFLLEELSIVSAENATNCANSDNLNFEIKIEEISIPVTITKAINNFSLNIENLTPEQIALLKGDKGEKGDKGDKGDAGATGLQGIQGIQGVKGDKGDKGDAFTYADFTPTQIADLQKPATDKVEELNTLENTLVNSENTRILNENSRVIAESSRVTAENARVIAENERKAALDLKLSIESPTTTGTVISFSTDKVYGTLATPETGNITADVTNAKLGVTNIIIHNSGTIPTFGSQFKKLSGSGSYVVGVVNYIYCTFITATEIIYSINQRS